MKVKVDHCGCLIERRYASDYLTRRLYQFQGQKGFRKLGRVEVEGGRWFELYSNGKEIKYKSSECPLLIITLEVLSESLEEGKNTLQDGLSSLSSVKGLQMNRFLEEVAGRFYEVLSVEEGSLHSRV